MEFSERTATQRSKTSTSHPSSCDSSNPSPSIALRSRR
jgi:hypothetical protein